MNNIEKVFISTDTTILQAMELINQNGMGIVLLVDENEHLVATISDGDIRRGLLAGNTLNTPILKMLKTKQRTQIPSPITALAGTSPNNLLYLMHQFGVNHVVLLDVDNRVVDVIAFNNLIPNQPQPLQAVIMAGGSGTRLRPLTDDIPKPMLPIGGKPLLEYIIEQLYKAGVNQIYITVNYMSEKIIQHFGDGTNFGVEITYVMENKPLGTAGALSLMEKPNKPFLVINGDILTRLDFQEMLSYHRKHKADMTIAARQYEIGIPYGVIESDGAYVQHLNEKPQLSFLVNAGIYVLESQAIDFIPKDVLFDMTDLIHNLLQNERVVVNFPIVEYWLDIGHHADYLQAQEDMQNGRIVS